MKLLAFGLALVSAATFAQVRHTFWRKKVFRLPGLACAPWGTRALVRNASSRRAGPTRCGVLQ